MSGIQPKRIAIVVDHPQRDLVGSVLVGSELCRRGHSCFFVPMNLQFLEICTLAPDVVLMNFIRRANQEKVKKYLHAGINVCVLDTEGGIIASLEAYRNILADDPEVRAGIDAYLSWGDEIAENLVEHRVFRSEQVAVTGNPRFDIYAASIRKHWFPGKTFPRRRKHILLIGTFTLVNPRFTSQEQEKNILVSQGMHPDAVTARMEKEAQALNALIDLANSLAETLPDLDFTVRPHPFESEVVYKQKLKRLPNLNMHRDKAIDAVLYQADALIHSGSTVSVEARLMGLKVLKPAWISDWAGTPVLKAVSQQVSSVNELVGELEKLQSRRKSGDTGTSRITDEMRKWLGPLDGNAYLRVAQVLEEVCEKSGSSVSRHACVRLSYGLGFSERNVLRRLSRSIRYQSGLPVTFSFRRFESNRQSGWETSAKAFTVQDVTEILRRIRDAIPQSENGYGNQKVITAVESGELIVPNPASRTVVMRPE